MLNKLKKTVKHTAIYSLGNLSTKLVGLILLPLYTSHLTTTEYGILSIIEITSQLVIGLFTFNLPQAMLRWCATEKDPEKDRSIVFSTLISLIIIATFVVGSLLPVHESLANLVFSSTKFSNYFFLLLIWAYFGILTRLPNSLIRLRERSVFFASIMVSKFTIILLANIYFVAFANLGVEGIVWGQILGEIYTLIITFPFILKNIKLSVNFNVVKQMLAYGFPMALSSVSTLILASGDRYVLTYYLTFASVGIYSLAQKIGGVINVFLLNSFQQGYFPIAFKMFNEPSPGRFFSKSLTYFTLILSVTALGLSLFSEELIVLLTEPAYFEAYKIVPLISFAFVIKGISLVFTMGFHKSKKTTGYAGIIIGGMALTILLNVLLIPFMNVYGAGLAMIISYSVMTFITYKFSQKLFFINYEIRKVITLIGISVFLYLISSIIPISNFYLRIGIKILLFIIYPFLLYFFNFFEEIELLRLKQSWEKWRNPFNWISNLRKIKF